LGITLVHVAIINPSDSTRKLDVEVIVDTGSILTWVKRKRLEELGISPRREKEFRTIEGRKITRPTGPIIVGFGGQEADVEVVFAEETDAEVLGVTALESLGFQVDPVTNQLNRSSLLAL
jgi:aspartyl protease family protein